MYPIVTLNLQDFLSTSNIGRWFTKRLSMLTLATSVRSDFEGKREQLAMLDSFIAAKTNPSV